MNHPSGTSSNTQRGQAIVLIAMGFVMLLAFTGLVVDVARVFVVRGELRRAVDAAGLAATAQFKRGATGDQIVKAADDLVVSHGIPTPSVIVETCNLSGTTNNANLCPAPGQPQRKLVRVKASAQVPMLFLQLVGIPAVQVPSENISEAASVDAVLVLDNSESQSYDFSSLPEPWHSHCSQNKINDMYACLNGGTLEDGTVIPAGGCNGAAVSDASYPLLTRGTCQPFLKTKEAAYSFITRLYQNYDRVAIISVDESADRLFPMGYQLTDALIAINNLDVYTPPNNPSQPNPTGHVLCNSYMLTTDKWKCGSSNVGAGLIRAHDEFGLAVPYRADSLWVTILLVDGPANRTSHYTSVPWSDTQYGICPTSERTTPLKCRDADVNSRHAASDPSQLYDADDYARDFADVLGLNPDLYPSAGSAGVLIYTIALGKDSVCLTGDYTPPTGTSPAICTNSNPALGDADAGEQLLRYIADVGDDGRLDTGPCLDTNNNRSNTTKVDPDGRSDDVALGLQCGNYYFAPDPDELEQIFLQIAGRIFTRITG
ncbi:MAG TPA: pilus assembly protein TadG-related protein [Anaerolineae bacterium]|nr:pilus assembly protein TadG-related protein [Anaerolineae bacterium]